MTEMDLVERVLWVANSRGEGVIGWCRGMPVFPSGPDQNAPTPACKTRKVMPATGDLEECLLYLGQNGRTYRAYLKKGGLRIKMPGLSSPCAIKWEENPQRPDEVLATIVPEGSPSYYRVWPGDAAHFEKFCPQISSSSPWTTLPKPGEETACWIGWFVRPTDGMITGYAYPAVERSAPVEAVTMGRAWGIEGHVLVLGHEATVVAHRVGKKLIITIE